jgi:metal-sulfur cluster biosynthetic enzyme
LSSRILDIPDNLLKQQVLEMLANVYDPELGIDVVNLGLIYGLECKEGKIFVTMTFTTPGCPIGESLADIVEETLSLIPGVTEVIVNITFDPPWNVEMISDEAKRELFGE